MSTQSLHKNSADLWKGKAFETLVHILFSLLWAYVSIVFWVTHFN
jgi:hypothetical protein